MVKDPAIVMYEIKGLVYMEASQPYHLGWLGSGMMKLRVYSGDCEWTP